MENFKESGKKEQPKNYDEQNEPSRDFKLVRFGKDAPSSELEQVRMELGLEDEAPPADLPVTIKEEKSELTIEEHPWTKRLWARVKKLFMLGAAAGTAAGTFEGNIVQAEEGKSPARKYEQQNWTRDENASVLTPGGAWALEYAHMLESAPAIENKEEAKEFINEAYQGFFERLNKVHGVALVEVKTESGQSMAIPLKGQSAADWLAIKNASTKLWEMIERASVDWQVPANEVGAKLDNLKAVEEFSKARFSSANKGKFDFSAPAPAQAPVTGAEPKVSYEAPKDPGTPDLVTKVTEQNKNDWHKDNKDGSKEANTPTAKKRSGRPSIVIERPTFGAGTIAGAGTYSATGSTSPYRVRRNR